MVVELIGNIAVTIFVILFLGKLAIRFPIIQEILIAVIFICYCVDLVIRLT
jgi:hypothetical protein